MAFFSTGIADDLTDNAELPPRRRDRSPEHVHAPVAALGPQNVNPCGTGQSEPTSRFNDYTELRLTLKAPVERGVVHVRLRLLLDGVPRLRVSRLQRHVPRDAHVEEVHAALPDCLRSERHRINVNNRFFQDCTRIVPADNLGYTHACAQALSTLNGTGYEIKYGQTSLTVGNLNKGSGATNWLKTTAPIQAGRDVHAQLHRLRRSRRHPRFGSESRQLPLELDHPRQPGDGEAMDHHEESPRRVCRGRRRRRLRRSSPRAAATTPRSRRPHGKDARRRRHRRRHGRRGHAATRSSATSSSIRTWDNVSPIPDTCTESKNRNSYIGCDYWPTVTLNPVYDKFDYAVAVSNPQPKTVDRHRHAAARSRSPLTVSIAANSVQAIPLPWVPALKGPQFDQNTAVGDPGQEPHRARRAPTTSRRTSRSASTSSRRSSTRSTPASAARASATAARERIASRSRTTRRCSFRAPWPRATTGSSPGRRSARRRGS